jgi:nucleotide-binding universal stress UspA family protein
MRLRSNRRLIWAIDPFNEDCLLLNAAISVARNWSETTGGKVLPVYVLSSRQIGYAYEFEYDSADYIAEQARDRAARLFNASLLPLIAGLEVLSTRSLSILHDINALDTFARKLRAEAILMATHGRSGLKRAILGSFAEAALLHSSIPVMTVNPNTHSGQPLRSILFPTEFGPYSRRVFQRVLRLAQEFRASITLLHVLPSPPGVVLIAGTPGYAPAIPYDFTKLESARKSYANRRFQAWSRISSKAGVRAESKIIEARNGIAATIVEAAREQSAQLVAIEAESGRIKSALLGSACRRVVRESPCPVWTIRGSLAFARKHGRSRDYSIIHAPKPEEKKAA